jgi:glycosyltransferase involved in cell wall biosynthesis
VITAPELARTMGLAGREKVERYFNWEQKIDSMIHIYREAIAGFEK